jgi:hypothetical protein
MTLTAADSHYVAVHRRNWAFSKTRSKKQNYTRAVFLIKKNV